MKLRSFVNFSICKNKSTVIFNDLASNGQAYSCAFIIPTMQTLEYSKDLFPVFIFKADAVIRDEDIDEVIRYNSQVLCLLFPDRFLGYGNDWQLLVAKFQCIANEILKDLMHLSRHSINYWQWIAVDHCVFLTDCYFQIICYLFNYSIQIRSFLNRAAV